ncbi:MAG: lipopolysaccharide biosynthesis protein [Bacteroidales bacterium]|nr:lipopolysaccharide biosynthesis protein [Bacteroidales bacterium]
MIPFRGLLLKIRNSELLKNVLYLLSSNGLAQLFPFLVYPFISRLYSTDAFGQLAIIVSIHSLLASISTGKYDQAIAIPKNNDQAIHLFNIGARIALGVSFLILPVVFLVKQMGTSFSFGSQVNNWFFVLAITVFSTSCLQLINGWSLRHKMFTIIAGSTLVLSLLTSVLKLAFGFLNVRDGLLIAFVAAQVLTIVYTSLRVRRSPNPPVFETRTEAALETAVIYSGFPKFYMINALLNTFSSNLPIYMFAFYFSNDIIGQFSVALALLFTPVNAFCNSFNQVLMKKTLEMRQSGVPVWPFIRKFINKILSFSVLPGIVLMVLIPWIIGIYLGDQWTDAGHFSRFLIPYAIGAMMSGSLGFVPNVYGRQLTSLLIYLVYLAFRIAALSAGILMDNVYLSVGLYALISLLAVSYQVFWYRNLIIKGDKDLN